jgi:hypothetical protein
MEPPFERTLITLLQHNRNPLADSISGIWRDLHCNTSTVVIARNFHGGRKSSWTFQKTWSKRGVWTTETRATHETNHDADLADRFIAGANL